MNQLIIYFFSFFLIISCGEKTNEINSSEYVCNKDSSGNVFCNLNGSKTDDTFVKETERKGGSNAGSSEAPSTRGNSTENQSEDDKSDLKNKLNSLSSVSYLECRDHTIAEEYNIGGSTFNWVSGIYFCGDINNRFIKVTEEADISFIYDRALAGYWSKKLSFVSNISEAIENCKKQGDGWALPEKQLLQTLFSEKRSPNLYLNPLLADLDQGILWSASETTKDPFIHNSGSYWVAEYYPADFFKGQIIDTASLLGSYGNSQDLVKYERNKTYRCFRFKEESKYLTGVNVTSISPCLNGQHLENGLCVENERECDSSQIENASEAKEKWLGRNQGWGQCEISKCKENKVLLENQKQCAAFDLNGCKAHIYRDNATSELGLNDKFWCDTMHLRFPSKRAAFSTNKEYVKDSVLNLWWSEKLDAQIQGDIESSCLNLGSEWRVPTIKELLSLVGKNKSIASVDTSTGTTNSRTFKTLGYIAAEFEDTDEADFWSKTSDNSDKYWFISFSKGEIAAADKQLKKNLRCVKDF